MWVADMDFAAPPGVTEALTAEVERATHGYYADTGSWAAALAEWMARRHGLRVDPAWVSPTPGIVSGLGLILQARERAGRRGRGVPAGLSRLPQDHRRQRAAHPRCAAGRDRRPLRHGSRRAAREADAAHQGRVLLQPAQSRRHGLVGRRDPRAGRLLRRARSDPGVRRDPLRSGVRRRQAHAHHHRRARDRGPPDHLRRRDQDLQPRRRPCRRLRHLERRRSSASSTRASRRAGLAPTTASA